MPLFIMIIILNNHPLQIASQVMTLTRLLPFIIGEYVASDDEHWECFLLLWDISSMACAFEVSESDATHLAWLVETYLEGYKSLYETSLIPKMHYLVHLPQQIIK